jgi:plasmid stabilization system protein ParE
MDIQYLPPARQEYLDAVEFYESQATGLGGDFIHEVERAEQRIADHPHAGSPYGDGMRRVLVSRFPFWVVYHLEPNRVVVVAIAHERRRPDYWQTRVR